MTSSDDNLSKAESFPLNASNARASIDAGKNAKNDRRLSFNQSVSQMSSSGSKTRSTLQRPGSLVYNKGSFLEIPPPLEGADVAERFESQRASFDLPALRQIIWITSGIGIASTVIGFLIQIIAHSHGSLHNEWGIGFWSGTTTLIHSLTGSLSLWRRFRFLTRWTIAKFYLGFSGVLAAVSVAEITCAVFIYHQAADVINTQTYPDQRVYKLKTMEISLFNSLLSACGLVGILLAIFASVVTLQRLSIELRIAQSFTTLISRRPSAIPQSEKPVAKTSSNDDEA